MVGLKGLRRPMLMATLCVGLLSGCALTFDASTLGVQASLAEPAGQPAEGEDFEINKKAVYLLFGILRVATPSVEDVLAGQLGAASEIQNVSIRVRSRFADLLVTFLTGGVVVPRSVTVTGTVVN